MVVSVAEAAAAAAVCSYAQARLAPATPTDRMDHTDVPIMYKRHMQRCRGENVAAYPRATARGGSSGVRSAARLRSPRIQSTGHSPRSLLGMAEPVCVR